MTYKESNVIYVVVDNHSDYKKIEHLFDALYGVVISQPFSLSPPYNVVLLVPEYDSLSARIHEWVVNQYDNDFINNFVLQNSEVASNYNKIFINYQHLNITIVKPEHI